MTKFLARRLLLLVLVILGMSVMTFIISHAIPGDPARLAAGLEADAEQVEALRRKLGLDRPLHEQYLIYMRNLAIGDLGESIHSHRPVLDDLRAFFPATLELTLSAAAFAALMAIPLGILSVVTHSRLIEYGVRFFSLAGYASPVFWLGLMAQLVFFKHLGWLPGGGRFPSGQTVPAAITGLYVVDSLLRLDVISAAHAVRYLILPAFVLAQIMLGPLARMTRSSVLEVLSEDYIRTARSKGLQERVVIYRHALRNALIPVVTLFGLYFGGLLGGAILTETIFSWPGLGSYALAAINTLDFPAIMGVSLLTSFIYVLVNLAVDLTYAAMDPRIRY